MNTYKERCNELTREMLLEFGKNKGNVIFSPFSILTLLCMAADSTDTKTREEVIDTICRNQNYDEIKNSIKELIKDVSGINTLSIASALCVNETISDTIKPGFKKTFEEDYMAKLFSSKNIIEDVNAWVRKKTKGMIDQIADKSMENMLACLMNAVCFESEWKVPYEEDDIEEDDFHNADGSFSTITSLFSKEDEYINTDAFEGFVKPYKDSHFSFLALLPKKKGNQSLRNSLNDLNISAIFQNRTNTRVLVNIPEFKFDFSEDLTDYLRNLGMEKIFTPGADFSPMTDEWIKADGIIHKAHIEVDRKGTKAAAVTAMVMPTGCAPDFDIPSVRLDRPFVYAIMHNETGLPIFAGIVNKL